MSVRALIVCVLVLAACKKSEPAAAPEPPSDAVISAMRDYCRIGELPRDKQREALKLWGWQHGGSKHMGPLWNRAAVKRDRAAIATVWAAADAAVGKGNCPLLEALNP